VTQNLPVGVKIAFNGLQRPLVPLKTLPDSLKALPSGIRIVAGPKSSQNSSNVQKIVQGSKNLPTIVAGSEISLSESESSSSASKNIFGSSQNSSEISQSSSEVQSSSKALPTIVKICSTCGKVFVSPKAFEVHMKYHAGKIKCEICGADVFKNLMKLHVEMGHGIKVKEEEKEHEEIIISEL
jgi:hypothetical protein